MAVHRFNSDGISVDSKGRRRFSYEYKLKVLEKLDQGFPEDQVRSFFSLTRGELGKMVAARRQRGLVKQRIETAIKVRTIRERLFEKAVSSVEESLDPLDVVIAKSPAEVKENPKELLPTAVGHLRNRGQNAIKVLEGLGDFRRAGDDIPKEAPRVPMFSLPAGTKVQFTLDVPKEESDGSSSGGSGKVLEAEAVDVEVQTGEPPSGDGADRRIEP